MKLRSFNDLSPATMPFRNNTSPLIKISLGGDIQYFNKLNDKLAALKDRGENYRFVIAWDGKWKTDVFELTEDDIEDILVSY